MKKRLIIIFFLSFSHQNLTKGNKKKNAMFFNIFSPWKLQSTTTTTTTTKKINLWYIANISLICNSLHSTFPPFLSLSVSPSCYLLSLSLPFFSPPKQNLCLIWRPFHYWTLKFSPRIVMCSLVIGYKFRMGNTSPCQLLSGAIMTIMLRQCYNTEDAIIIWLLSLIPLF